MIKRASNFLFNGIVGVQNTGARFYDALKDTGRRRRNPPYKVRHADNKLRDRDRRQMSAKSHEIFDNFSIMAWAVRKHLDYVASLTFRGKNNSESVNKKLEEFIEGWSPRLECHSQRKHSLPSLIRLIEQRKVLDGDVFVMKVAKPSELRGSIQLLEADRIATPIDREARGGYDLPSQSGTHPISGPNKRLMDDFNAAEWVNGVQLSKHGIAKRYAVHRRAMDGSLQFERYVNASNMVHHGYFDRADQVRGITPLTPAYNMMEDIAELHDYFLGKAKLSQILGAFITRDAETGFGAMPKSDRDQDGVADSNFQFEFTDGVNVFDLNPGEAVQTVQDGTISTETIQMLQQLVLCALKSLDLPYSFYSEDYTNWYGSRGALIQYQKSTKSRIRELQETMDEVTRWRFGIAVAAGELQLPKSMSFEDLRWKWVPDGVQWWDPVKEVTGYKAAMAAGLMSPQTVCTITGQDFREVIKETAEAQAIAKKVDFTMDWAISTSSSRVLEPEVPPPAPMAPMPMPGDEPEEEEEVSDEETEQGDE